MKKYIKLGSTTLYDTDLIYSHLIGLQESRDSSMKDTLQYELPAMPTSLFHDGSMCIPSNECSPKKALQVEYSDRTAARADAVIIDRCGVMWVIGPPLAHHWNCGWLCKQLYALFSLTNTSDLTNTGIKASKHKQGKRVQQDSTMYQLRQHHFPHKRSSWLWQKTKHSWFIWFVHISETIIIGYLLTQGFCLPLMIQFPTKLHKMSSSRGMTSASHWRGWHYYGKPCGTTGKWRNILSESIQRQHRCFSPVDSFWSAA